MNIPLNRAIDRGAALKLIREGFAFWDGAYIVPFDSVEAEVGHFSTRITYFQEGKAVYSYEIAKVVRGDTLKLSGFNRTLTIYNPYKAGDKVTHFSRHKPPQKGVIKKVHPSGFQAWVVFHCADEWDNYQDYTGALTHYCDLKPGWPDKQ